MHGLTLPDLAKSTFALSVEVLPPRGNDASRTVSALSALPTGVVHFLNIADSPMARPRMSPTVLAGILQNTTHMPAIVHLTVRDRNRVALESEILGAQALGIRHHLAVSGDSVAFCDRGKARAARDLKTTDLIRLCADMGQVVGAVFDVAPGSRVMELRKAERKVRSGARFIITQPAFDEEQANQIALALKPFQVPVLMGILPLYSARHTEFLNDNVPGILIPEPLRQRMRAAGDPVSQGIAITQALLQVARGLFQGACIMPPFGHYELVGRILASPSA